MQTAREKIREAVKYNLTKIIEGDTIGELGYTFYNTVKERNIYDPIATPSSMVEFPAVNVTFGDENCSNINMARASEGEGNKALLYQEVDLILDFFLVDINNSPEAQEKILADVKSLFGVNYYIPDSSGNRTVFNCMYRRSQPFGLKIKKPNMGITIEYLIWYRERLTNANILA